MRRRRLDLGRHVIAGSDFAPQELVIGWSRPTSYVLGYVLGHAASAPYRPYSRPCGNRPHGALVAASLLVGTPCSSGQYVGAHVGARSSGPTKIGAGKNTCRAFRFVSGDSVSGDSPEGPLKAPCSQGDVPNEAALRGAARGVPFLLPQRVLPQRAGGGA